MTWAKIELPGTMPLHLDGSEMCYNLMEYTAGGGYAESIANQRIHNFKKEVDRKGKPDWYYKEQAIQTFAQHLSVLIPKEGIAIAAIPTSKALGDPEYDSRFDDTLAKLKKLKPMAIVERPFSTIETHVASHKGGSRSIEEIYANLQWHGFSSPPTRVILIDDVITMGTHFKACERLIHEHHPGITVYGVFWAKCIWPENEDL